MFLDETVTTIPTYGFNLETIEYKEIEFSCCDISYYEQLEAWKDLVVDNNTT